MNKKSHRGIGFVVALTIGLGMAATASAQFTWTGLGVDDKWSNPDNWDPDTGYPSTTAHDAIFDDTQTGTVDIDADVAIRYLYVSQSDVTNTFDIAAGKTFSPVFWQAYLLTVTNHAIVRGGTFRPRTSLFVGNKSAAARVNPRATLVLTNTVLDQTALTALHVGINTHVDDIFSLLDARHAQFHHDGTDNTLTVPTLSVGRNRGVGELYLPSVITNFNLNAFYLGTYHNPGTWNGMGPKSWIDLGDNPQLSSLKIKNFAQIGTGDFRYRDANGDPWEGLPPNLDVQIGETGNPATFRLAYMYNTPTDVRWGGFRRFEGHFSELIIGYCPNSQYTYGELDLAATNTMELTGDITAEDVETPILQMGGLRTGATGVLKMPGTVTNLIFDTFIMGEFNDLTGPPNYSILHLGSNAQARAFTVRDIFRQGLGKFQYVDAGGTPREGFPDGLDFRVGTPERRAEFQIGACNGLNSVSEFGSGIERFEAWLSSFTVSKRQDAWGNHYVTATLDLREADVVAIDVDGDANIGHHAGARSTVYLADGTMRCASLSVGRAGGGNNIYDNAWFGHLHLSNTVVVVTNQATIGQTGRIFSTLDGYSSGIDLETDQLAVAEPHPTTGIYGKIELTFASNPLMPLDDYFGLRIQGDAVAFLQGLTNATPSRLTWNIDGLSPHYQERFGIHYHEGRDLTIVGVERMMRGTMILIR